MASGPPWHFHAAVRPPRQITLTTNIELIDIDAQVPAPCRFRHRFSLVLRIAPDVAVPPLSMYEHVACLDCKREVVIRHEDDPLAARLWAQPWSCPYRRDCGRVNYVALAGVITDVARADQSH